MAGRPSRSQMVESLTRTLFKRLIGDELKDIVGEAKKLAPLSKRDLATAQDVLSAAASRSNAVVSSAFNLEMTHQLMSCLRPHGWLNDEVINFYVELLGARQKRRMTHRPDYHPKCHFFSSFFFTKLSERNVYNYDNVKRWSKRQKLNIFELDKLIVPAHVGLNHWCVAVANMPERRLDWYDSMGGGPGSHLNHLRMYIADEARTHWNRQLDMDDWTFHAPSHVPRQMNGWDCGVFACKFADYLSENREMDFSQADMSYFRLRMTLEIKYQMVL